MGYELSIMIDSDWIWFLDSKYSFWESKNRLQILALIRIVIIIEKVVFTLF